VTYAPLTGGLGGCPPDCYSPYWRLWQSTDDVYVMRLAVSGVKAIASSSAALLWVKAVGQLQRQNGLNINGITLEYVSGDSWILEVVFTSATTGSVTYEYGFRYDDDKLAEKIATHPAIRAEWPNAQVAPAQWLELSEPPSAVSYWRAAPVLWAHQLSSPGGLGGPSAAFGRGEGVWRGTAAARQTQIQPTTIPPVGGKNGKAPAPLSTQSLAMIGAAGLVLWFALGGSRRKATS